MSSFVNFFIPDILKEKLKKLFFGASRFRIHFSQSGEDVILIGILREIVKLQSGYYVDVGAFHPTISSNTYELYRRGWRGINIEPRPGSKQIFDKERPGDINLEVGIGSENGINKYYYIDENSSMNSFSKKTLQENDVFDQVKKVIDQEVVTLNDVFLRYLPKDREVDFLNIDAEGYEMEVISTIDWEMFRPKIIAIEQNATVTLEDVLKSETYKMLISRNYSSVAKTVVAKNVATIFYIDNNFL